MWDDGGSKLTANLSKFYGRPGRLELWDLELASIIDQVHGTIFPSLTVIDVKSDRHLQQGRATSFQHKAGGLILFTANKHFRAVGAARVAEPLTVQQCLNTHELLLSRQRNEPTDKSMPKKIPAGGRKNPSIHTERATLGQRNAKKMLVHVSRDARMAMHRVENEKETVEQQWHAYH